MGNEHAVLARLDRARKCYGEVEALAGVDLKVAEALAERVAVLNRGPIVAEGSVHEVRSRVAQRRIRCTTALAAEWVSAWPHCSMPAATASASK